MMATAGVVTIVACGELLGSSRIDDDDGEASDAAVEAPLVPLGTPRILSSDEKRPCSITLDPDAFFWRSEGDVVDGGSVQGEVVRLDRAPQSVPRVLATGINEGRGLAMDSTSIYWLAAEQGADGRIGSVPKGGGMAVAFAPYLYSYLAVGADAADLFYLDAFGELFRATKAGATTDSLRPRDPGARSLLVADEEIYVGTTDQIAVVRKDGTAPAALFASR